jgi:gluconolactonase
MNYSTLAVQSSKPYFHEAGVWIPGDGANGENGTVWFSGNGQADDLSPAVVHILNLSDNKIHQPPLSQDLSVPNGGTLYGSKCNHSVLLTSQGSMAKSGSIVKINTKTYEVETLVNSYWGLRMNSPNDVAFATFEQGNVIFFTDPTFGNQNHFTGSPQQSNAVWRLDLESGMLVNVISALDIPMPNGVRLNKEWTRLYVTDWSGAETSQKGNTTASTNIYVFDLDNYGTPMNKRVFATSTHPLNVPDGIKVDDEGRVWTGEGGGVFVRSKYGRILGFINPVPIVQPSSTDLISPLIANFALAGDEVVIAAENRIYRIKLTRQIVSPDRVGGA